MVQGDLEVLPCKPRQVCCKVELDKTTMIIPNGRLRLRMQAPIPRQRAEEAHPI
jgi:hypothetical protein